MREYSRFFRTIYDEPAPPVGSPRFGRQRHFSVLQYNDLSSVQAYNIGIVWDEDHDTRVIWILEQLGKLGRLDKIVAIGESKGHVTVYTRLPPTENLMKIVEKVSEGNPGDPFTSDCIMVMTVIDEGLTGLSILWSLGPNKLENLV